MVRCTLRARRALGPNRLYWMELMIAQTDDVDFLKNVTLFIEFDADELDDLRQSLHSTHFAPGDVILEEGNANRALHIVKTGRIRVTRRVQEREVTLCDLASAQTFGELSIIEDGVASATLHAVAETEVLSISMADLASFLRQRPSAAAKFWREIAVDLRRRLLQTNDVVRSYFEVNRALIENPTFREAYAMCNR
ncbi:MAG TPA: cyclic nucleotide-binding domain-containing protein [Thermoanaerobaculia bacterium]|nr:cyclic nucleotide-binding domain-containing protein [Thermoanaerobaculia bacterium]